MEEMWRARSGKGLGVSMPSEGTIHDMMGVGLIMGSILTLFPHQ